MKWNLEKVQLGPEYKELERTISGERYLQLSARRMESVGDDMPFTYVESYFIPIKHLAAFRDIRSIIVARQVSEGLSITVGIGTELTYRGAQWIDTLPLHQRLFAWLRWAWLARPSFQQWIEARSIRKMVKVI
jgi:hypothetical protein